MPVWRIFDPSVAGSTSKREDPVRRAVNRQERHQNDREILAAIAAGAAAEARPSTAPADLPPSPLRLVRSASFTAALREICEELFKICDRNKNGVIDRDEYRLVARAVYAFFRPQVRVHWVWREMDKDKDGKVSLDEWLSATEAIADFVGEKEFLEALTNWSTDPRMGQFTSVELVEKLHDMILREKDRKKVEGEPFEAPGSAGLKPPFADIH